MIAALLKHRHKAEEQFDSIIDLILGLMADPYAIFLNAASAPYQFELSTLVTAIFHSVFSNPFMNIVAVILSVKYAGRKCCKNG